MTTGSVPPANAGAIDAFVRQHAELMIESAQNAAYRAGTKIVRLPEWEMPDGACGYFTADPRPHTRRILIREGLLPLDEAIVLAHEVGHRCDPALNTHSMEKYYARHTDACEAVAHYTAYLVTREYRLLSFLPDFWFLQAIEQHCPVDRLLADDAMVHRADIGAREMLWPEARQRLQRQREGEGRPLSGLRGRQRTMAKRLLREHGSAVPPEPVLETAISQTRSADHGSAATVGTSTASAAPSQPCGAWMPLARARCQQPQGHSGSCHSR